tara:strand:+ start:6908 stop:9694 length:2787 start_codon:yes stop_codon:yes gene_type:complete
MPKKSRKKSAPPKVVSNTGTQQIVRDTRRGGYGRSKNPEDQRLARNRYGKGGIAGRTENTALQQIARDQALLSAKSGEQNLAGRGRYNIQNRQKGTNLVGGGMGQDPNEVSAYFKLQILLEEERGKTAKLEEAALIPVEKEVVGRKKKVSTITEDSEEESSEDEGRINISELADSDLSLFTKKDFKGLKVKKKVIVDGKLIKYNEEDELKRRLEKENKQLVDKIKSYGYDSDDTELLLGHSHLRPFVDELVEPRKSAAQYEYERNNPEPDMPLVLNERLTNLGFNLTAREVFSSPGSITGGRQEQLELLTPEEQGELWQKADLIMTEYGRPTKKVQEYYQGKTQTLGGNTAIKSKINAQLEALKEANRITIRTNPELHNKQQAERDIQKGPEAIIERRATNKLGLEGNLKEINPALYRAHIIEKGARHKHYNQFTEQEKKDYGEAQKRSAEGYESPQSKFLRRRKEVVRQPNFQDTRVKKPANERRLRNVNKDLETYRKLEDKGIRLPNAPPVRSNLFGEVITATDVREAEAVKQQVKDRYKADTLKSLRGEINKVVEETRLPLEFLNKEKSDKKLRLRLKLNEDIDRNIKAEKAVSDEYTLSLKSIDKKEKDKLAKIKAIENELKQDLQNIDIKERKKLSQLRLLKEGYQGDLKRTDEKVEKALLGLRGPPPRPRPPPDDIVEERIPAPPVRNKRSPTADPQEKKSIFSLTEIPDDINPYVPQKTQKRPVLKLKQPKRSEGAIPLAEQHTAFTNEDTSTWAEQLRDMRQVKAPAPEPEPEPELAEPVFVTPPQNQPVKPRVKPKTFKSSYKQEQDNLRQRQTGSSIFTSEDGVTMKMEDYLAYQARGINPDQFRTAPPQSAPEEPDSDEEIIERKRRIEGVVNREKRINEERRQKLISGENLVTSRTARVEADGVFGRSGGAQRRRR